MQQINFLLQFLLLAQHASGTIMSIIRSSRVLYKWLLPVVFGAWFSSCRYGVELRVLCPVCGLLLYCSKRYTAHPHNRLVCCHDIDRVMNDDDIES
jgi:hypothetical protein